MDRRSFCKLVGIAGGTVALGGGSAAAGETAPGDTAAILADLTECLGCRGCEAACAEENGLPEPPTEGLDEVHRSTSTAQWTVVNRHQTAGGPVYLKQQCMHCNEPACAAACLTKALVKTKEGPVVWREDKCMGCRFCMISCPFNGPKFEFDSPVPRIQKCRMCWERMKEDEVPACVEACDGEPLTFGRRSELIEVARSRIYSNPDKYVHHIYGEHEVGGTGWLYLSPVPFEELGLPTHLGDKGYPSYSKGFLTSVPFVLILWPALLLALRQATGRSQPTAGGAS